MSRYRITTVCLVLAAAVFVGSTSTTSTHRTTTCSSTHSQISQREVTTKPPPFLHSTLYPDYQYPESYKDHVYTSLSEKGRDLFFAIKIHPSCLARKGQCIPRRQCIEKKMLYISRVCYYRDRVCCYEDNKFITVEHITKHPPPTKKPAPIESYLHI
ncbi:hypothetical protein B5X24_HaOG201224 [Helicoverpa armigera]|nr:hypothetical protein B5X24_HaOG201224 [Helicoverpa armigera]